MTLELVYDVDESCPLAMTEDEVLAVAEAVLAHQGVERDCSLSLSTVDDDEMAELNAEWRGVDKPTDVLSFECERPDDPDLPEGVPCELGDVVLAPAYVAAQAARMGTTEADETRLLLVHGVLHLLGYDHEDPEEAALMQRAEEEILASIPNDGTLTDLVLANHREEGS